MLSVYCFIPVVAFYIVPGWFWGDPHFITLDGGNYTFNGLGEYVMIDSQNEAFKLQARTRLAQGNSNFATIFTAGAAKEENSSVVEVKVKKGGETYIPSDTQGYKERNEIRLDTTSA